jgi:hypothetical protein
MVTIHSWPAPTLLDADGRTGLRALQAAIGGYDVGFGIRLISM